MGGVHRCLGHVQPCLPLPLHLKVAEDSPGLPSGQQGLGVPEVWSLGTVDLSSLWALHGHVTPGAPGAWCLKEFENSQTVSVVKSVAVLFAIYWIINYNCDEYCTQGHPPISFCFSR